MRTELDHLPSGKQGELEHVVQVLFEGFSAAQENANGRWTRGRIVEIILYGSHARGGWVDEPHRAKGYVSEFDLLVTDIAVLIVAAVDGAIRFIRSNLCTAPARFARSCNLYFGSIP